MRVLFVYKEKNGDNLFVPVIRTRLSVHGIEAISSVDEFWNPSRSYDIIHIHWPEEVVGWNVNDVDIDKRLETRLRYFKEKGSPFYSSCHHGQSPYFTNRVHCYPYVIYYLSTYSLPQPTSFQTHYYSRTKNLNLQHTGVYLFNALEESQQSQQLYQELDYMP